MRVRHAMFATAFFLSAGCSEDYAEAQPTEPQEIAQNEPEPIEEAPQPAVTYATAVRCAALAKVFVALSPDNKAIRDGFNQFLISARSAALRLAPEYGKGAIDVDQEIDDLSVRISRQAMNSGNISEFNQNLLKEAQQSCAAVS